MRGYIFQRILSGLVIACHALAPAQLAHAQEIVGVGELSEGQWAEGRDLDPFGKRPLHFWLPEGTLIFDIAPSTRVQGSNQSRYRDATTYHGYPVHLNLRRPDGSYKFRDRTSSGRTLAFRLTEAVYCPGGTSPIIWPLESCIAKEQDKKIPVGEGWTFYFKEEINDDDTEFVWVEANPSESDRVKLAITDDALQFRMRKSDMDEYERLGVIFRLDREHPLTRFVFVVENFLPCNTTVTNEFKEEDILSLAAKASVKAEAGFWTWFKASLEGSAGYENKNTSVTIRRSTIESTEASIFQQWGVMRQATDGNTVEEIPFMVQKEFQCRKGSGSNEAGDKISKVTFQIWNADEDSFNAYEFDQARMNAWLDVNENIYRRHQRPILLSINSKEDQASVISNIMGEHPEISYNLAIFMFGQMNNVCQEKDRSKCAEFVTLR